jgi:SAM-dependent methyltransferase
MDHRDHVALLRPGVPRRDAGEAAGPAPVWADLGAGTGAFTLALAELLGPGATILAVDRDAGALRRAVDAVRAGFPAVTVEPVVADLEALAADRSLPALDGMVAANSLHFLDHGRQAIVLRGLAMALLPGAPCLVVEYDADRGNPWVPNPFSARSWPDLATAAGLVRPRPLGRVPNRFLGAIYSAAADRPIDPIWADSDVTSRSMSDGST